MSKFVFLSVLAVLMSLNVNGQIIHHRQCPTHPITTPFFPGQYTGRWYQISRYETGGQVGGDCVISLYTLTSPFAFHVQYNILVGRDPIQTDVYVVVSFPDESPLRGVLSLSFDNVPPATPNYWILGTDFVNYSIVWNCQNLNATSSSETAWVLSRQSTIAPSVLPIVNGLINQFLVPELLRTTLQDPAWCGH